MSVCLAVAMVDNVPQLLLTVSCVLTAKHTARAQSMQKKLAESNGIHGALHVCTRPEKLHSLLNLSRAVVKVTG